MGLGIGIGLGLGLETRRSLYGHHARHWAHVRGGGKHADTHDARALGRGRASARVGLG